MNELILSFHGVGDPPAGTDPSEIPYWWDKPSFLAALEALSIGAMPQLPQIKITFDDGNKSDALIALPALAARGLKATFFVCAGRIGKSNYLDAAAIEDLLQGGMDIGSHGMNHVDWRSINDAQLHAEITDAKQILEQVCGRPVCKAGIPFGSYDRRVLARLRSEEFQAVYSSDGGVSRGHCWLKPRNTLDHSFCGQDLIRRLIARDSPMSRLHRFIAMRYKSLR